MEVISLESLTEAEIVNNINYPGISRLYPEIESIISYSENLTIALTQYFNGEKPYIDALVIEVTEQRDKVRNLCTTLANLVNPPHIVLEQLRAIQTNLGILAKFPQNFKEGA